MATAPIVTDERVAAHRRQVMHLVERLPPGIARPGCFRRPARQRASRHAVRAPRTDAADPPERLGGPVARADLVSNGRLRRPAARCRCVHDRRTATRSGAPRRAARPRRQSARRAGRRAPVEPRSRRGHSRAGRARNDPAAAAQCHRQGQHSLGHSHYDGRTCGPVRDRRRGHAARARRGASCTGSGRPTLPSSRGGQASTDPTPKPPSERSDASWFRSRRPARRG